MIDDGPDTAGEALNSAEAGLVRESGGLPSRPPSRLVVGASMAARGSLLWLVIAAVLASRPGARRRAAARGVVAVAVTSALSHLVGKLLVPRRRPRTRGTAARQALPENPTSSAFPSAHAASATAFATAVLLAAPSVGLGVAPVAAVVCYSRIRTGVHWPSDVLAGVVLGAATAVATRSRSRGGDRQLG